MKILGDKVLLKKLEVSNTIEGSEIVVRSENDALPQAEVILASEDVKAIVEVGDKVYYIEPRERGKVKYNGEDHFITPISAIVAIL